MSVYTKPDYNKACLNFNIWGVYRPTAEQIAAGDACSPATYDTQQSNEQFNWFNQGGKQFSCHPLSDQGAGRITCDEAGIRIEYFNNFDCTGPPLENVLFQEGCQEQPLEMHKSQGLWWKMKEAGWSPMEIGRPDSAFSSPPYPPPAPPAPTAPTATSSTAPTATSSNMPQMPQQDFPPDMPPPDRRRRGDDSDSDSSDSDSDDDRDGPEMATGLKRVNRLTDQAADMANELEIPGQEDWRDMSRQVEDAIEQGMVAYEKASGAFEGDDGRTSGGASLAAAFTASALAVAAIHF